MYTVPGLGQAMFALDMLSMALDILDVGGYDKMGTKVMYYNEKKGFDDEFKSALLAEGNEFL